MSLIRSTTNPEGLYIVGTGNDDLEIMRPGEDTLKMKYSTFIEILKKCYECIEEDLDEDLEDQIDDTKFNMKYHGVELYNIQYNWKLKISFSTWYYLIFKNKYRWLK